MSANWHELSIEAVSARLGADAAAGLSAAAAVERLRRDGPNRLRERPATPAWRRLLAQVAQPLVIVLIVSGGVTALLGEWVDAGVIIGVVVVNAWIGFVQEGQAEQALLALARTLASEVTVLRDSRRQRLPAADLVVGDLVLLAAGDRVPADLRLTEARELTAIEAALTGESLPARKGCAPLAADTVLAERSNMAFAGTTIASGRGAGIVVATADATETGRIAAAIAAAPEMSTPLTRRMASFANWLLLAIGGLALLTFAVGVARGESVYAMFMAAVALSVGAIPEGLPAAITITLAIGVARMARRRAIVRRLPAVETLGSTTVICSDKTGTLTENQMTVRAVFVGGVRYSVGGDGYRPQGTIAPAAAPPAAALRQCLIAGALCNDSTLSETAGQWQIAGDPTEGALLVLARKGGFDEAALAAEFPRVDELPFDSSRQLMATLHAGSGGRQLFVKGALEQLLPRCHAQLAADGAALPLDPAGRAKIEAEAVALAAGGLRVLALASGECHGTVADHAAPSLDAAAIAGGLVFCGLVGMLDPPRAQAIAAVRTCHAAGIAVKMVTGDHVETARAIAGQLGIANDRVLSGRELAALDAAALQAAAAEVAVFARVEPEQKLRLVQALQARGQVVAMTGDGVNDAPALKAADIGIAMGAGGTEVAKEAAAMVLTDDNFATIEAAVEEGRGVFDNLVKFIVWTLPTNFGEGLVIVAAVLAGVTLPITPLQILWINMTTAVLLGLMLAFEPVEAGIMQRPPRDPRAPLLDRVLIVRMLLVSVLMLVGAFGLFLLAVDRGAGLAEARTIAMNVFVASEIAYLFNCRSLTRSWIAVGPFSNRWFWGGIGLMGVLQLAMTYLPLMQRVFQTAPLGLRAWAEIVAVAVLVGLAVGAEKAWRRRRGAG